MLNCRISAPGKVILHGEHAVVFGKDALVSSIGLRTNLYLEETKETSEISIKFESLSLEVNIGLNEINAFLENACSLPDVKRFVADYFKRSKEAENNSLIAFCFIMLKAFDKTVVEKAFKMSVNTELRIGAGSGSSATFGVCIATACLLLAKKTNICDLNYEMISNLAFESERIMHMYPSGVDNTICTYGGIIKFSRQRGFSRLVTKNKNNFNVLLVDSGVSRNTGALVSHVHDQHDKFPSLFDSIFNSIQLVVDEATKLYTEDENADFKAINDLFEINNGLLRSIGVSHPSLEQIFLISQKNGFSCKITGAGGGGYALILLPPDFKTSENYKNLCLDLKKFNFDIVETVIGSGGVLVESI